MAQSPLKTDGWKYVDSKVGITSPNNLIDLPSGFSELLIRCYTDDIWGNTTLVVNRQMLSDAFKYFITGGYFTTTTSKGVNIKISLSKCGLVAFYDGGSNAGSSATTEVYYK